MTRNQKKTTYLAAAFIALLICFKATNIFTNEYFELTNDIVIVCLLLAFAENILVLMITAPDRVYKRFNGQVRNIEKQ